MFKLLRYLFPDPTDTVGGDISQAEIEEIYKEVDKENPSEEDPDEGSEAGKEKAQPDESQNDDQEANPDEKEKKPDVPPEEQKPEEEKDPAEKPEEEGQAPEEKPEELTEERINAWAVKHKMTVAEAKADLEATLAVMKNYKSPEEIARALRSTQSEFSKLRDEAKKADEAAQPPVFQRMDERTFLAADRETVLANKEKIVEDYREKFPAKSELMTDDAIIEEVAQARFKAYEQFAVKKEGELKAQATSKRDQILNDIPEADKRWIPQIKETLTETSDAYILGKDFDVKHIIAHARGMNYHEDIKKATDEAYQRGLKIGREDPKPLGMKSTGSGAAKGKTGAGGGSGWAGTEQQKRRAQEMFPDYDAEKAFSEYQDTWKDELKKDKNFIG